jgi:uroporphyrinogen-III synthase
VSNRVLILRPQPGADESAARARRLGLEPLVSPLFIVRPLGWSPPDPDGFDAILLTSANAARHGGPGLARYLQLPCYAVGERTAEAAQAAGFADIRSGPADGAALVAQVVGDGIGAALHLCGRDHVDLADGAIAITAVPVYAADPVARLPDGIEQALVLLHSPRAAAVFAGLAGPRRAAIRIAAISTRAAAAAGPGWKAVAIAAAPRDHALLELAAKLCQTDGEEKRQADR